MKGSPVTVGCNNIIIMVGICHCSISKRIGITTEEDQLAGISRGETLARKCYASRHTQNRHGQAGASTMLCCNTLFTYLIIMNSISTNAMFYILFRRQQHINIIFRDIHKMSYTHLKNNKCTHAQAFHQ